MAISSIYIILEPQVTLAIESEKILYEENSDCVSNMSEISEKSELQTIDRLHENEITSKSEEEITETEQEIVEDVFAKENTETDVLINDLGSMEEQEIQEINESNEAASNLQDAETGYEILIDSGNCGLTEADNLIWEIYKIEDVCTLVISGNGAMKNYEVQASHTNAPWYSYSPSRLVLNEGITRIGDYAFTYCKDFTGELIIPSSVEYIGKAAFGSCSGFGGDIIIPLNVTEISELAFARCDGITNFVIYNAKCKIGNGCFAQMQDNVVMDGRQRIVGYRDSTAQIYAEEVGCIFITLHETEWISGIIDYQSDTWNFRNAGDHIPFWIYNKFFSLLQAYTLYEQNVSKGGLCYGLAIGVVSSEMGYPTKSSWIPGVESINCLNDVMKETMNTSLHMNAWKFIQSGFVWQMSKTASTENKKNTGNYNGLYDAIEKYTQGDTPIILLIFNGKGSGHALVPLEIVIEDGITTIQVYDCNYPNQTRRYTYNTFDI